MKTKVRQREKKLWRAGIFFIFHFSFFIFLSCSSDDDIAPPGLPEGRSGISFEIGFAGQDGLKTATDKDFKTMWETGDEVGLFIVKGNGGLLASGNYVDNMKMTYNGTSWSYTLPAGKEYYPNDDDNLHFYAYYPYVTTIDPTSYTFSVQANQNGQTSGKSNYNLSDLLLAKAENVAKSSNAVQLTFSHALSLVQVEVKREVNVPHFDADDFTVTLTNAQSDASVNWSGDLTGTGTPTDIVMHKVADATGYIYRALVPAQTLATDSKVTFVQNNTGKEIDMEYQGIKDATLTAKNAHKYSVTLGWGIDENHAYAVGDVYPHTGPAMGIVFWIDPASSGKHGKIVGLEEFTGAWASGSFSDKVTNATDKDNGLNNMQTIAVYIGTSANNASWTDFPAFNWVHSMNDANEDYSDTDTKGVWYLPARDELTTLYNAKAAVNTGLTSAGGTTLSDVWYWSSSEDGSHYAYVVFFSNGGTYAGPKSRDDNRARCVFAF